MLTRADRNYNKAEEYRVQNSTTGPAGGFLVPEGFANVFSESFKQFSAVLSAATVEEVPTTNNVRWPGTEDVDLGILTDPAAPDLTGAPIVFTEHILKAEGNYFNSGRILVSAELWQDMGEIGQRAIARTLASRVQRGFDFIHMPLLANSIPASQVGTYTGQPSIDDISQVFQLLSGAYFQRPLQWLIRTETFKFFADAGVVTAVVIDGVTFPSVWGFPVFLTDFLLEGLSNRPILFGSLKEAFGAVIFGKPAFSVDMETDIQNDQIGVFAKVSADAKLVDPFALAAIQEN